MLAAGDTFRAAAVEQLQAWGERNDVPVVAQASGADAASVIYDALEAATARNIDVLIADTAGRLHTKSNLMDELAKITRVMKKVDPDAPHEVLLVVDAGTGQNALNQAVEFHNTVGLTGIALTKLDGTAKGGVVVAIADAEPEGPTSLPLDGSAFHVRFSPDGTLLAVDLAPRPLVDDRYMFRRVSIVDAATGELRVVIESPGKLGDFDFSPDGEKIAVLTPTTSPLRLKVGPPELPRFTAASICRSSGWAATDTSGSTNPARHSRRARASRR